MNHFQLNVFLSIFAPTFQHYLKSLPMKFLHHYVLHVAEFTTDVQ